MDSIRGLLDGKSGIASSTFSHQRGLKSVVADCTQGNTDPLCLGNRAMGSGSGYRTLSSNTMGSNTMGSSTMGSSTMGSKMGSSRISHAPTPNPTSAPAVEPTAASSSGKFLAKLKPLLSSESLTALNVPDSPQSQSLRWLLEKSNFQAWPFHRQVQRFAMATIYYATGGPSWWSNAAFGNWLTNETECAWFQVGFQGDVCSNNGTLQYLIQENNFLKGAIPDEIGLLTSLAFIDLSSNSLSGTVPSQLGSLTALTWLDLSYLSFNGTVPSQLGSLTALRYLDLNSNSFTGIVPSQLGSMTALTSLLLNSNSFKGTVPSELGSLTALKELLLSSNSFNATVPSELGSLTELRVLDLSSNFFTGTVPKKLGSMTALKNLDLSSNAFKGTVPSELGSLTALNFLSLSSNSFKGTVPSELGSLTALSFLGLNNNVGLNGTVPAKLCNPVSIYTVFIYIGCDPGPECSCCTCI